MKNVKNELVTVDQWAEMMKKKVEAFVFLNRQSGNMKIRRVNARISEDFIDLVNSEPENLLAIHEEFKLA